MAVYAEERGAPTLVEAVPAADPAPLGLAAFALTTYPQRPQRHVHPGRDLGRTRHVLRRAHAAARGDVGVQEPQRLRSHGVLDVRRLLALARRVRRARGGDEPRERAQGPRRAQLAGVVLARLRD